MRRLTALVLFACLPAACRGSAPAATTPQPSPVPTQTPVPGPWQPLGVHIVRHNVMTAGFLTADYGISGGVYPGNMFVTADGGQTWIEGSNLSDCRYGMDIVDTQVAWTCGGMLHVRRSTDGGRTWLPVADFGHGTTRPCHTISFLDDTTGWLATLYLFGATEDGGATWSMVPGPEGLDDIASIDLVAPGRGYLLDFSGVLYATQDNGAHWETLARLDLDGLVIPRAAYQMAAMRFSADGRGLIVVSETYQKGRVRAFHTSDGGLTWTSEPVPVTSGPVFLSRLEPLLTVLNGPDQMTLMRYSGE